MYVWFVFLHVLGIFGFLVAHGVSAGVFFALKHERNVDRICMLLQLSSSSARIMIISLLTLLISGIITGFLGHWWRFGWIWLSLSLFIGIYAGMSILGTRILNDVRMGIGLPSAYGQPPRPELFSAEELNARLVFLTLNSIRYPSYGIPVPIISGLILLMIQTLCLAMTFRKFFPK